MAACLAPTSGNTTPGDAEASAAHSVDLHHHAVDMRLRTVHWKMRERETAIGATSAGDSATLRVRDIYCRSSLRKRQDSS